MFEGKWLEAHQDKTSFLVCGSKEYKRKVEKELEQNPLKFGEFVVKRRVSEKYLGHMFNENGAAASVEGQF